jgi:hypothetical protein
MRGGVPHDLISAFDSGGQDQPVKYCCARCGEGYQIRATAASCRIQFLERMEQLDAPHVHLQPAARRALLDILVRRTFKWPRPLREAILDQFERWQAWKTSGHAVRHE